MSESEIDRIAVPRFERIAALGLVDAWADDATAALHDVVPSELRHARYSAADGGEAVYHDLTTPKNSSTPATDSRLTKPPCMSKSHAGPFV